jgi:sterol desaturase/sphingolipid hydroxylase (fatty acid hydroxylase superfamily)
VSRIDNRHDNLESREDDAWLARPSTIRLLWRVFAVVLAVSVAAQLLFKVKGYFTVDGWLGFGAIFGFLSCVAMVLFAKVMGWALKRDEHYYAEPEDD